MASPQKENGFTAICNELMDVLSKSKFNGTQFRIVNCILRYTYGFQRKEHEFSLSFLAEATNTNKMQIKRELTELINNNVITVIKEAGFNTTRILALNKNYETWLSVLDSIQGANSLTVSEIDNIQGANSLTGEGANSLTKKENIKENYKEIYDYYIELNLIKHRTYTEDMAKVIKSAMKNNKYTIEYCKTLLDRHKKVVELTKKEEYPVKARSLIEFFGQKVMNAKYLICAEYEEGGAKYEKYLRQQDEKPKRQNKSVTVVVREC